MVLRDLGSKIKSKIIFGVVLGTEKVMRVVVIVMYTFPTWGMEVRMDETCKLSGARGKWEG